MSAQYMNLKQTVLTLEGSNSPTVYSEIPAVLNNNLRTKAVGISNMYLSNTNIPIFIPKLATPGTMNFTPGAATNTILNNTDTQNVLDYFVVIRNQNNTQAVMNYINWGPMNKDAMTPPPFVPDVNSIFTCPYYYCFDFMKFLNIVNGSIQQAIFQLTSTGEQTFLIYDAESNTFNLAVPSGLQLQISIEFSDSLLELLPFSTTRTPYRTNKIDWSQMEITVNGDTYSNATAPLYDTIFPFDLVLLHTNMPLVPIEFISNRQSAYPLNRPVVFMFRKQNPGLSIYNAFVAANDYLFDKVHQFTQDQPDSSKMNLTLILRTRQNKNYIEWPIPYGSTLELVLNTYRLM
jgi:hypothetical protein